MIIEWVDKDTNTTEIKDGLLSVSVPDELIPAFLECLRNEVRKTMADFWPSSEEWDKVHRLSRYGWMVRKWRKLEGLDREDCRLIVDFTKHNNCRSIGDVCNRYCDSVIETNTDPSMADAYAKMVNVVMAE